MAVKYVIIPGVSAGDGVNIADKTQIARALAVSVDEVVVYQPEAHFDKSRLDWISRLALKLAGAYFVARYGRGVEPLVGVADNVRDRVVDFLALLFVKKTRNAIMDDMAGLARQYPRATFIGFSNGSIILYYFLKTADPETGAGDLRAVFAGSPLPWLLVQAALMRLGVRLDGRLDCLRARNLYSRMDPVTRFAPMPARLGVSAVNQYNAHCPHDLTRYLEVFRRLRNV